MCGKQGERDWQIRWNLILQSSGHIDHHDIVNYYLQGIFTPKPQFIALPGSSVTDIPIPDDMQQRLGMLLVPLLQQQGRIVKRVLGDGYCLFRSLSLQLTGIQDHQIELNRVITEFEKKSNDRWKLFMCASPTLLPSNASRSYTNVPSFPLTTSSMEKTGTVYIYCIMLHPYIIVLWCTLKVLTWGQRLWGFSIHSAIQYYPKK